MANIGKIIDEMFDGKNEFTIPVINSLKIDRTKMREIKLLVIILFIISVWNDYSSQIIDIIKKTNKTIDKYNNEDEQKLSEEGS